VTATTADPTVASSVVVSRSGATRTLTVTPTAVGRTTITITATAPDGTTGTATIPYGVSPYEGDPSDRYYSTAGNGSSEIDVGGGNMIVADDLSNVLRLYNRSASGPPAATYDFTSMFRTCAAARAGSPGAALRSSCAPTIEPS
jgi:hypothetical protein